MAGEILEMYLVVWSVPGLLAVGAWARFGVHTRLGARRPVVPDQNLNVLDRVHTSTGAMR